MRGKGEFDHEINCGQTVSSAQRRESSGESEEQEARTADMRHKEKGTQSELGFASVGKFSTSERDTCSVLGPERVKERSPATDPITFRHSFTSPPKVYALLSLSLSLPLSLMFSFSFSPQLYVEYIFFSSSLRRFFVTRRSTLDLTFPFARARMESSQSPLTSTFSEGQ